MRIINTSIAQKEKIRPEISHESHTRLIRAMAVAGYIYEHINKHSCEHAPMPWLPEIIDYLREDISCIFKEIDEWELNDIVKRLNFDYIINMSYSLDFRRKVLAIKKNKGLSIRETAKYFCIGSATVSRWIKQIKPKPAVSRKRKIDKLALKKDVERYPDAYQKERAVRFGVCQKAI